MDPVASTLNPKHDLPATPVAVEATLLLLHLPPPALLLYLHHPPPMVALRSGAGRRIRGVGARAVDGGVEPAVVRARAEARAGRGGQRIRGGGARAIDGPREEGVEPAVVECFSPSASFSSASRRRGRPFSLQRRDVLGPDLHRALTLGSIHDRLDGDLHAGTGVGSRVRHTVSKRYEIYQNHINNWQRRNAEDCFDMNLKPPTKIDLHKSFDENDAANKSISRKEKKLVADIKKTTKVGNKAATKILAWQLVRLRQQILNLQGTQAQIRGVDTHTQAIYADTSISAGMKGASKAMSAMNKQMESAKQIKVMKEF